MKEIDFENLDLKSMTLEEIVSLEKEYLINVLGKKLIDSNERDDRSNGYRILARKYWPEEFANGKRRHIHHIDFNHSNNVVSNLVVLTPKEHTAIHYLFDPKSKEHKKKIGESRKGKPLTEETRKKISEVHKGKPLTEETRKKISEVLKGKPNGPFSEERKKKISESLKGKTFTEEHKKKIGEVHKGKPLTEETRKKISESCKGKTPTEETKKKLSEVIKGKHWYKDPTGKHVYH
jgi:hypothetical protein